MINPEGIEYKITDEGLQILFRGTSYIELGNRIKKGKNLEFIRLIKDFSKSIYALDKK